MDNDNDIPIEIKQALIEQQVSAHKNGRYQTQVLVKVRRSIGEDDAALKPLVDDLIRFEKMIYGLKAELKALVAAPPMTAPTPYSDPENVNLDFTRTGRGANSG
jgi:hypothetical protein